MKREIDGIKITLETNNDITEINVLNYDDIDHALEYIRQIAVLNFDQIKDKESDDSLKKMFEEENNQINLRCSIDDINASDLLPESIKRFFDQLVDVYKKQESNKSIIEKNPKYKYHTKVVKVDVHNYRFFTFNNITGSQISCITLPHNVSQVRYIDYDSKNDNVIFEFDSDIVPTLTNNYIEFIIGNDSLVFNIERYNHYYIHDNIKYVITDSVFKNVLKCYYANNPKKYIEYDEYRIDRYFNKKCADDRDNTLMINILCKYGYIPNKPFGIDERWFTEFLDFNKEGK